MSDEACPLPTTPTAQQEQMIVRMLKAKRIAVVGLSDDPMRASYRVAEYLKQAGKTILPVNPNHQVLMDVKCYASLADVPPPIDLVDVFRRPEFAADVTRQAIAAGAQGVWLQSGITSKEAKEAAHRAGIVYIEDRCLMVEHMRHA